MAYSLCDLDRIRRTKTFVLTGEKENSMAGCEEKLLFENNNEINNAPVSEKSNMVWNLYVEQRKKKRLNT